MVPAEKILARGKRSACRHHRPQRPHHAVARRDGARGPRDGAPGLQAAAAHRRRHHQPRTHGRQDRAALQRTGGTRARRQPRRSCDHQPSQRGWPGGISSRSIAPSTKPCAKAHAAPRPKALPLEAARARRTPIKWRAEDIATPEFTGVRVLDNFPLATLREFIDWTPFFHTWELKGVYPRILDDVQLWRRRRA